MKRITINKGYVGMVYRSGDYQRIVQAGKHWIGFAESYVQYNLREQLHAAEHLDILLVDDEMVTQLDVLNIADNHLLLRFDAGILQGTYTAGRYCFWKAAQYTYLTVNMGELEIDRSISKNLLTRAEIVHHTRTFCVESYQQALLFVDGKYEKELEAGVHRYWKNNTDIKLLTVDTRAQQIEVSGQEVLTKDKASLRINFYAHYKVTDIHQALLRSKDYASQLYLNLQMVLREYVGAYTLDELLADRDRLATEVHQAISTKTKQLGVEVSTCGLRDIILSGEMKDIMNQVLLAQKKAQATSIMRREETASTRSLLNTAKLMEDNQMLYKLKEMEYVERISEKINSISVSGGGQVVDQLRELFSK